MYVTYVSGQAINPVARWRRGKGSYVASGWLNSYQDHAVNRGGRRRGASVPRCQFFHRGSQRGKRGNLWEYRTLRSLSSQLFLCDSIHTRLSCDRALPRFIIQKKKESSWAGFRFTLPRKKKRCYRRAVDKRSKLCTKEIGRSDSRGRYPVQHIRCNSISRERERERVDQGCNAVWT